MLARIMRKFLSETELPERLEEMRKRVEKAELVVKGIANEAESFVLGGVPLFWEHPVLIVAETQKQAEKLQQELQFYLKESGIEVFLLPQFSEEDTEESNLIKQGELQIILLNLEQLQKSITIVAVENPILTLIAPEQFREQKLILKLKEEFSQDKIIEFLVKNGYVNQKRIDVKGTFARRGAFLDIYLPSFDNPVRLEFFGDQLESIILVDKLTGEILRQLPHLEIHSLKLLDPTTKKTIFDYCNQDILLTFQESPDVREYISHLPSSICHLLVFNNFPESDRSRVIDLGFKSVPSYWGQLNYLEDDLINKQKNGWQILLFTEHKEELMKLLQPECHLTDDETKILLPQSIAGQKIYPILVKEGKKELPAYQDSLLKFAVLTDRAIFQVLPKEKAKKKRQIDQDFILSLKPGNYVVHVDHGIGKFDRLTERIIDNVKREYFELHYAERDRLFVPADQADRINRYVGVENPVLNRLSGVAWMQAKLKVKSRAREVARKLLELYAHRVLSIGHRYSQDSHFQKELEKSFPYELTDDQKRTLSEVKEDLESEQVMDRLICGDVGFGKTEIALRAAFKAVEDHKQVALLAPTTILVEQHLDTFRKRLSNFPIRVEALSRFKTKKEQAQIVQELKEGKIDIIIGTHRLIQNDVQFKNLGLVIIDEEQRFGVTHKERFKEMRNNVDMLTLSATPIPRTLNLSLGGIRAISTITTPPSGRLSVETYVQKYSDEIVKESIERELKRGGQVYFLHNNVSTIESTAYQIKKLVPEARVIVAHGQMEAGRLEIVMEDFYHQKYNVLVCSSIIENGLDVPTVNTLIVDEATRFGLAQLYQLRGRIGRSHLQAYAYFLYQEKSLVGLARRRLEALLEAQKLGSGFEIAMRDLEIRGAGNILGTEQHGQITAVGLSLYSRLLHQAVEEIKSGRPIEEVETTVDLPLETVIPETFLDSEKERIELYQKIANFLTIPELFNYHDHLKKKHRELPQAVENLFTLAEIKLLAHEAGIIKVETRTIREFSFGMKTKIVLTFKIIPDLKAITRLLQKRKGWRVSGNQVKIEKGELGENWVEELKGDLEILKG